MIDAQLIVDYSLPLLSVVGILQVSLVILIAKRLQRSIDSNRSAITMLMMESVAESTMGTDRPWEKKKPTKKPAKKRGRPRKKK